MSVWGEVGAVDAHDDDEEEDSMSSVGEMQDEQEDLSWSLQWCWCWLFNGSGDDADDDDQGGRVGEWRESDARVGGGEHEVPSLLTVPLLSTAQQSLLLWFSFQQSLSAHCASAQVLSRVCSSYMPPLLNRPSQLEKKKATLESNLELPRHGFTKWFDIHSFPQLSACCPPEPKPEPTWTQLEHFSHVGGVGGAVHNRGGGILHFSFVIQTDGRVVFFHNPEQAMAEHFFFHKPDQWQSSFLLSFTYFWLGSAESLHKISAFCLDLESTTTPRCTSQFTLVDHA